MLIKVSKPLQGCKRGIPVQGLALARLSNAQTTNGIEFVALVGPGSAEQPAKSAKSRVTKLSDRCAYTQVWQRLQQLQHQIRGMENPQAGDSSAGKAADSSTAAAGSGRTTPGWNGLTGQNTDDVSRLARAALQGAALFAGSTGGSAQAAAGADGSAAAAGNLLDPLNTQQLTTDQLAAMLSTGGYTATALGSLGNASLQAADNAAALNALLLGGGLNLNQLAAQNLQLAGLGDLSALGALVGGDGQEGDEHGGGSKSAGMNVATNKQLSSRFRGVCWNKKNKRWQAAINSSGKYLYLGSFTCEDDAARQFDRAAIKLRGKKAKLNFDYNDYVDEHGELLDEIILPQGATGGKDDPNRGSTGGARRGSKSAGADAAGLGLHGMDQDMINQATFAALMQQGAWQGMSRSGKTAVVAAPLALEKEQVSVLLPPGCSLEYIVPVQDTGASSSGGSTGSKSLFGVVYKEGNSGMFGAGVWTGYMFKAFGLYATDGEAAQTARCAGELLSEDRDLRVSGGVANQQSMGLMAGPAGIMANPAAAAAAFPQDALALAGLAAGLGGSRGTNGSAGVTAAGLLGMGPGALVGAGMGGLANVSLAQAAQLAQQAAAEQGLPMSYPPLSVALPVVTSALQLLPGAAGAAGSAEAAAGGLDMAAAAAKASSEAEMQQLMQQLMQQQQQPQLAAAQQQLGAAVAGGDGFLKLANLDMMQLRQQLLEQQQGVGGVAGEAELQHQGQVLGSIPGLDTAGKRRLEEDASGAGGMDPAAAAAVAEGGMPADLLAQSGAAAAALALGGDAGTEHAAKRIKIDEGVDAAAAAAAAAVSVPVGLMGVGGGGDMAQLDLQDALKMLRNVQHQQQPPAQE